MSRVVGSRECVGLSLNLLYFQDFCVSVNRYIEETLSFEIKNIEPIDIEITIRKTKGMSGYSLISRLLRNMDIKEVIDYGDPTTIKITKAEQLSSLNEVLSHFVEVEENSSSIRLVE